MLRIMTVMWILLLGLAATITAGAVQAEESQKLAITGKILEVGRPVQLTVDGFIDTVSWSPGGKQLVYSWYYNIEQPGLPATDHEDAETLVRFELRWYDGQRTTVLKRVEGLLGASLDWSWMPDSKSLFVVTQWMIPPDPQTVQRPEQDGKDIRFRGRLEVLSLQGGAPHTILEADNLFTIDQIWTSPDKTKLLLYRYIDNVPSDSLRQEIYLFNLHSRELTSLLTGNYSLRFWAQDSSSFYYAENSDKVDQTNYYRYELQTKTSTAINREEMAPDILARRESARKHYSQKDLRMDVEPVRASQDIEDGRQIQALWLVSESSKSDDYKRALITTDIAEDMPLWHSLSPDLRGLAYVTRHNQLFVVPFTMRDPESFEERRACGVPISEEELNEMYLRNAHQIAIALIMYAEDHGTLPPADDVTSALLPYVKDKEVFLDWQSGKNIFRYLGNNESYSSIASPATTLLGYLDTGGDRIPVLYADGHSKYEKRPQK